MNKVLYEVRGPGCAILGEGGWSLRVCPVCKRELGVQTGNFSVELICSPHRGIW